MPPPPKTCPKMVLPMSKGGSLCVKDVLQKNFWCQERIPLSALAPARRAAPLPGEAARAPMGWPPTSRWLTSTAALIQNNSGLPQGPLPTLRGRLSLQQNCMGRGPTGGHCWCRRSKAGRKPRARHRTARVHHGPRWCGGGVAACRARAAGAGIRVRDATTISIWLNFFRTLRLG
jgi:hypothetical protein